MTTYPLSDADREIQERARRFVDEELIPLEVARRGARGPDPRRTSARSTTIMAIELGLLRR